MSPYRVALGGTAAFVLLVAIQHAFRSDLPAAEHFISEYALGDGGWVQVVAFLLWAVGMAASARLAGALGPGRRLSRGFVVAGLLAGAVGAIACAAFATQTVGGVMPAGVDRTTAGRLHDLGSLFIFAGLLVAAVASTRSVRRRGYRLGVLASGAALFAWPAFLVAAGHDAPGWGQRGFVLVGCLWLALFAIAARSSGASTTAAPGPATIRA